MSDKIITRLFGIQGAAPAFAVCLLVVTFGLVGISRTENSSAFTATNLGVAMPVVTVVAEARGIVVGSSESLESELRKFADNHNAAILYSASGEYHAISLYDPHSLLPWWSDGLDDSVLSPGQMRIRDDGSGSAENALAGEIFPAQAVGVFDSSRLVLGTLPAVFGNFAAFPPGEGYYEFVLAAESVDALSYEIASILERNNLGVVHLAENASEASPLFGASPRGVAYSSFTTITAASFLMTVLLYVGRRWHRAKVLKVIGAKRLTIFIKEAQLWSGYVVIGGLLGYLSAVGAAVLLRDFLLTSAPLVVLASWGATGLFCGWLVGILPLAGLATVQGSLERFK